MPDILHFYPIRLKGDGSMWCVCERLSDGSFNVVSEHETYEEASAVVRALDADLAS